MKSILQKKVLVLNKSWLPIRFSTVQEALSDMNSKKTPKTALKIEYVHNPDGSYDFGAPLEILPLKWEEWMTLLPREHDEDSIRTPNMIIRVPTVVIATNYSAIPMRRFRPTKSVLYSLQKGKDAYTGLPISYNDANIDHILPRSKGGLSTFENQVITCKKINSKKADKMLAETDLTLHMRNKEPMPMPATIQMIKESIEEPDWKIFLFKQ